jgi:hypothetical protein
MTLWRAMLYQLFAGGMQPRLSLRLRAAGFISLCTAVAAASYNVAPVGGLRHLRLDRLHAICLTAASVMAAYALLFVLCSKWQRSVRQRLKPLYLLPLPPVWFTLFEAIAQAPFIIVASAIVVPVILRTTDGLLLAAGFAGVLAATVLWLAYAANTSPKA